MRFGRHNVISNPHKSSVFLSKRLAAPGRACQSSLSGAFPARSICTVRYGSDSIICAGHGLSPMRSDSGSRSYGTEVRAEVESNPTRTERRPVTRTVAERIVTVPGSMTQSCCFEYI
jgi:hypothetical protein